MNTRSWRVLVVEDEPFIAADLAQQLGELGHVVVGVCHRAEEAMHQLGTTNVDLVLLDIRLGKGMDGVELAERINARFQVPFLYITSHADEETLDRVQRTRPAGFVLKPFDENELRMRIKLAMAQAATKHAPAELVVTDGVFIRDKGRLVKLVLDEIVYAQAEDNYALLHALGRRYVLAMSLNALLERLAVPHLLRVHRAYAVDLRKVTAVEEGLVKLGDLSVPVGKTHREELLRRLRLI